MFFLVGLSAAVLSVACDGSLADSAIERSDAGSGTGTLDIRADVDAFDEADGFVT